MLKTSPSNRQTNAVPSPTAGAGEPTGKPKKPQTMVNSIVQALSILRFLSRSGESQGVTAIARAVGINPSSAFNIVKTLTAEKFLIFNEKKKSYELGPGAMELAGVALDNKKAFDRIRDLLDDIAMKFSVTSALWRLTDDERLLLVGIVDSKAMMRIQMTVGQRIPAYSGAMGRCYAAKLDLNEEALRRGFDSVRWQQEPDFDTYVGEVQGVPQQGWAVDLGQFIRGVTTVAAPIVDAHGKPRFFIANSSFVGQLDSDKIRLLGKQTSKTALKAAQMLYG